MQYNNFPTKQRGLALLVSLVVLTAMTVLGLSSIRNTSTQQLIIKNMQFLTSAQNTSHTEINGLLNIINNNDSRDSDQLVLDLMGEGEGQSKTIANTKGNKKNKDELVNEQVAFDQKTKMTMLCKSCNNPIGGFSFGFGMKAMIGVISSEAALNESAATSTQEQGFWYLTP